MGLPRKRRKDQIHPEGYGTDATPNPSEFMLMLIIIIIIIIIIITRKLCSEITNFFHVIYPKLVMKGI